MENKLKSLKVAQSKDDDGGVGGGVVNACMNGCVSEDVCKMMCMIVSVMLSVMFCIRGCKLISYIEIRGRGSRETYLKHIFT